MMIVLYNKKTKKTDSFHPVDAREALQYPEWVEVGKDGRLPYVEAENPVMPTEIAKEEEKAIKKQFRKKGS